MFFLLLLWPFCPDQNNQTTLQDLNDETKLQEVRDSTGLGKSQTAEVAWLDHLGIPYEEHDVGDFYRFLQCKRIAFPGKVNPEVKDCIVSFPGKYSKDPWHPLAIL